MNKEIQGTKDYEVFQQFTEQRQLTPATTAKIQRSMKKRGFVATKPIIVNSQMEVVDGQHRLQAAKNLGLCVYYVVDDSLTVEDVRDLAQASAAWSFDDYVTSHVRQGHEEYTRLRELKELSGLSWGAFMYGVFPDAQEQWSNVTHGRFNLSEIREGAILEYLTKFELFKPLCKFWTHRAFTAACSKLFAHPAYKHHQMQTRLEYQSTRLVRCPNTYEYLAMLQDIYNYRSQPQNIVDFTAGVRRLK